MKSVIKSLQAECLELFTKSISYGLTKEEKARMDELDKAIKVLEKAQKEEAAGQPKVLSKKEYADKPYGVSLFSGDRVHILGEQTVALENGKIIEQYLYDIVGYTPENGLPFAALKSNIALD